MFCVYTRLKYQVSVCMTIGPLVICKWVPRGLHYTYMLAGVAALKINKQVAQSATIAHLAASH